MIAAPAGRRHRPDRGFTLLEVLIALSIAGLGLGALFQGSLGGLRATAAAGQAQEALSRARSRLATIGHGAPLLAGDRQGDDGGGYRWRTSVVPVAALPGPPGTPAPTLFEVRVSVSWGGDGAPSRGVSLVTRRLGATAPSGP